MAYTYRWSVERVDGYPQKDNFENLVSIVFWECEIRDMQDGSIHQIRANTELDAPDPSNYTDYLEVSEEELLTWVWQKAPKDVIEKMAYDELIELQNPQSRLQSLPQPWLQDCCPDGTGMDQGNITQYEPPTD